MKTKNIAFIALLFSYFAMSAQDLLTPSFAFSHKKTAYITLLDGTEIQGNIKDIDRKKGLIEYIKIKDGAGEKHKLDAEEIKFMYLPPSGLDKLSKSIGRVTNARNWKDDRLNDEYLNLGYIYFELSDVKIKKKNRKLLMQLLNPSFSKEVKVYHDPFAGKTASLGIGNITLVGGLEKSYYISKDNNPAYKLKKKNYKDEFIPMWGSCDQLVSNFPDPVWRDFTEHVLAFSKCQ